MKHKQLWHRFKFFQLNNNNKKNSLRSTKYQQSELYNWLFHQDTHTLTHTHHHKRKGSISKKLASFKPQNHHKLVVYFFSFCNATKVTAGTRGLNPGLFHCTRALFALVYGSAGSLNSQVLRFFAQPYGATPLFFVIVGASMVQANFFRKDSRACKCLMRVSQA